MKRSPSCTGGSLSYMANDQGMAGQLFYTNPHDCPRNDVTSRQADSGDSSNVSKYAGYSHRVQTGACTETEKNNK